METNPTLSEFDSNISYYVLLEDKIRGLPERYVVGSVIYTTEQLKEALAAETVSWKQNYGQALAAKVSIRVLHFFNDNPVTLSRGIQNCISLCICYT